MKRSCLVTVLLTAAVMSAAWLILDPEWKETEQAAPGGSLELRREAGARPVRKALAAVPADPALYGSVRLVIPVLGVRREQLTDTFDQARGEDRQHQALDIMAPLGTPVIAAAAGWVEQLFVSKAGGNAAYVRSPNRRTIFYYAHLDRYAPSLAQGSTVQPGTPLGTVGFTGNADPAGPHLHFAVLAITPERTWSDPATPINPYELLTRR